MVIDLLGVLDDGSQPQLTPIQPTRSVTVEQMTDVKLRLTVKNPSGRIVDLSSAVGVLTVTRRNANPGAQVNPIISRGGVPTGGQLVFDVVPSDTDPMRGVPAGQYSFDVAVTIGGLRDLVIPLGSWFVTVAASRPGVPITVPDVAPLPVLGLPSQAGHAGQFLQTDGAGNLSWADAGGAPFHAPVILVDDGGSAALMQFTEFAPGQFGWSATVDALALTAGSLTKPIAQINADDISPLLQAVVADFPRLRAGVLGMTPGIVDFAAQTWGAAFPQGELRIDLNDVNEVVQLNHWNASNEMVRFGLFSPFIDAHLAAAPANSYFAIWDGPLFNNALWSLSRDLLTILIPNGFGQQASWNINAAGQTDFQTLGTDGTFDANWNGAAMSFLSVDQVASINSKMFCGSVTPDGDGWYIDSADAGSGFPITQLRLRAAGITQGTYGGGVSQFIYANDIVADVLAQIDLYQGGALLGARDSFLDECYYLATPTGLQGWVGLGATPEEVFAFDVASTQNDSCMQLSFLVGSNRVLKRVVRDPGTGVLSAP